MKSIVILKDYRGISVGIPVLTIVDDDQEVAGFVKDVAELAGFDAQTVVSAKEFQKIYTAKPPSGIVLDIVMPDMDGNELLQWLSKQGCTTPIILMSGYEGKYLEAAEYFGSASGINIIGTLVKPMPLNALKSLLQKLLDSID